MDIKKMSELKLADHLADQYDILFLDIGSCTFEKGDFQVVVVEYHKNTYNPVRLAVSVHQGPHAHLIERINVLR
jgi:hypothetical protein